MKKYYLFLTIFLLALTMVCSGSSLAGLIAYWPLDEGSGQFAGDTSGNGNNGVLGDSSSIESSDPVWVMDSDRGNVLQWAGDTTRQWINLTPHLDDFRDLSQGTIVAWVKLSGSDSVDVILAASDSGDSSSEMRFFYDPDYRSIPGIRYDVREGGDTFLQLSTYPDDPGDDVWHHVAVTVDSDGFVRLYVDGEVKKTGQEVGFFSEVKDLDHMSLGCNIDSGGVQWAFKGLMSDVAVFDEPLSPSAIAAVYHGLDITKADRFVCQGTPSNGQTHVDTDAVLSWVRPDGVVGATLYDVYFGTDPDFSNGTVSTGQNATTYDPGDLNAATEYFWRVDVSDSEGDYEGYVMSFTTGGKASDPVPVDGQVGVFTGTMLSWTGDDMADSYDVYFAEDGQSLEFLSNINDTNYTALFELKEFTIHNWRVDSRDSDNNLIATGDVWSFETAAAGSFFEEVDIFVSGNEGYACYRIPAILVAPNGDIMAFCEGRKNNCGDHGNLDIVMKRSTDMGQTWGPLELVYEEGDTALITIGNPCPVVDKETGRIWLPFCRDNDRIFVGYSDDNGHTWSQRREVTESVKDPAWGWYATGPGVGIQIEEGPYKGRLVIPSDHRTGNMGSHMMYSDDHGSTWHYSERILPGCNECQVVEMTDGKLMNNARTYEIEPDYRGISTSTDGGATWSDVWFDHELPEPTCQASFLRYTRDDREDKNRLLFSNPAHTSSRVKMTIKMSYDEGQSWPVSRQIYEGSSAYSCLVVMPNWTIGCFYEKDGYGKIALARFSLEWLTNGTDKLQKCTFNLRGDVNSDCIVNMEDFAIIAAQWLQCNLIPAKACTFGN